LLAPFEMTVCGIEELTGHCAAGVTHVLSILDPAWPVPSAFGEFGEHERLELRFHDVIEASETMTSPAPEHVERLLAFGRDLLAEPAASGHLLVHCHAGISRSSAAMGLILAQALAERSGTEIFAEVLRIRPRAWPNLRMVEMGDAMLGRGGELIAAAHRVYRHQVERRPEMAEFMAAAGRAREVEAAMRAGGAPCRTTDA
jgi:predicted protein tyrosine phosphatase